jgi:hypothetical protein
MLLGLIGTWELTVAVVVVLLLLVFLRWNDRGRPKAS